MMLCSHAKRRDTDTKGCGGEERQFKTCRKRCKTRILNCQQETKVCPRARASRTVDALGEEESLEDLSGKKP